MDIPTFQTFPQKGYSTDLYLHELNDKDQLIVYKHLRMSGQIRMYNSIRQYLTEQIHHKKSEKKRVKFYPKGKTLEYYEKYIFEGKSQISSLTHIFCLLKSELEETLKLECPMNNFNYVQIYYSGDKKPAELLYDSYEQTNWELSTGLEMSVRDIEIMENYKTSYLSFLQSAISCVRPCPNRHKLEKQYEKLVKITVVN